MPSDGFVTALTLDSMAYLADFVSGELGETFVDCLTAMFCGFRSFFCSSLTTIVVYFGASFKVLGYSRLGVSVNCAWHPIIAARTTTKMIILLII